MELKSGDKSKIMVAGIIGVFVIMVIGFIAAVNIKMMGAKPKVKNAVVMEIVGGQDKRYRLDEERAFYKRVEKAQEQYGSNIIAIMETNQKIINELNEVKTSKPKVVIVKETPRSEKNETPKERTINGF